LSAREGVINEAIDDSRSFMRRSKNDAFDKLVPCNFSYRRQQRQAL